MNGAQTLLSVTSTWYSVVNAAFQVEIDTWRGRKSVKAMLQSVTPARTCPALEACLEPENLSFAADLYATSDAELCEDCCESPEDIEAYEAEREKKEAEVFSTLEAGQTVRGTVKRLVDYGAFIDIGGVDGLAHISDLAWHRVKHPSDVLEVGQELDVYVKSVDPESKRISLSVKDTMRDPWYDSAEKYSEGQIIEGKVIKLTDFGAFMEIEPGFDGLIPMGELADKRIERADEAVHVGDIVRVKILRIDTKRKRISLSITKARD